MLGPCKQKTNCPTLLMRDHINRIRKLILLPPHMALLKIDILTPLFLNVGNEILSSVERSIFEPKGFLQCIVFHFF